MKKRFKAVLLDFDGTLLDSKIVDEIATRKVFQEHLGREFTEEEFAQFLGMNSKDVIEMIAPDRVEELDDKFFHYGNEHRWRARLFPGVRQMLERFKDADMPLAVVTAQSRRELEVNREHQNIDRYISHWVSNDDVSNSKPAPDQIFQALSVLEVDPREAIIIGDTRFDILAGKNAGTSTGAAMWGVHDPQEMRSYEPDYYFYSPEEVIKQCLNHAD